MQGINESIGKQNTYSPDTVVNTINNLPLAYWRREKLTSLSAVLFRKVKELKVTGMLKAILG